MLNAATDTNSVGSECRLPCCILKIFPLVQQGRPNPGQFQTPRVLESFVADLFGNPLKLESVQSTETAKFSFIFFLVRNNENTSGLWLSYSPMESMYIIPINRFYPGE